MNDQDAGFTIIRDTREKKGHGWYYPEDGFCTGTVVGTLKTGDYSVFGLEGYVCVERKRSITEWSTNCATKRWTNCMERMSKIKHAYLIMEFDQKDLYRFPHCAGIPEHIRYKIKMPAKLLRKKIHIAREKYGIHVILCPDKLKAEKLTYRILKKAYELQLRC